jgi:lysophospholipase L1-like esterase
MDYIRLGASGTTLCTDGHAACNVGKLTEANLAGADVVTILMGINDFVQARNGYYTLGNIDSTDTSTIYGAVHMWCQRIEELRQKDSLKNTEFYFLTPVITSWNNSVSSVRDWNQEKTNIHGYTLRDLCNAIIEVCALYEIPVIDLNLISGLYYNSADDHNIPQFGGDGAHPGTVGHQMMADAIKNALLQNNLRHDHSYGSWITTTYPDCDDGEQQRVCSICTATERRTLESKGHHYENGICTQCGIVQTSTFQILDTRCNQIEIFTYEVGMTWREWLNSKYNTGMGSCIAIWVSEGPNILGSNPYMDIFVNGDRADYNAVICRQDVIELVKYG